MKICDDDPCSAITTATKTKSREKADKNPSEKATSEAFWRDVFVVFRVFCCSERRDGAAYEISTECLPQRIAQKTKREIPRDRSTMLLRGSEGLSATKHDYK